MACSMQLLAWFLPPDVQMPAPTAKVLKKKTVMLSMAVFFSYWNRRSRIVKLSAIPNKRCEAERP